MSAIAVTVLVSEVVIVCFFLSHAGEITQTVEPGTAKPATAEADGIITVVIVG